MRRLLFTFIVVLFIAACAPSGIDAFPGDKIAKTAGQGVVWTAKGIGKAMYWTGKGVYKVAEFFVVETLRPFKAIRDKMVDVWGVPSKE